MEIIQIYEDYYQYIYNYALKLSMPLIGLQVKDALTYLPR